MRHQKTLGEKEIDEQSTGLLAVKGQPKKRGSVNISGDPKLLNQIELLPEKMILQD